MRLTRLSPNPLVLGIVALGLPFAVTVGWTLGDPATTTTPPPAAAPAGAGGIGTAPVRVSSAPVTAVDYTSRGSRTSARASSTGPVAVRPSASSAAGSPAPVPTLTDPPVPTPTTVTSAPASPTPTPTESAAPEPTGIGLIRR